MKTTLLLLVLAMLNCAGPTDTLELADYASEESGGARGLMAGQKMAEEPANREKKVIQSGDLSYRVKSVDETYQRVLTQLGSFDAYLENEYQSSHGDRITFNLSIRVPSDRFDSLFQALAGYATYTEHRAIRMEDVTSRYYDMETRLKNKKALEQRYVELLKETKSIGEILEIERNLNDIRTQIEMEQGQFNYLSKQVSMSTINLSFYEVLPYQYVEEARPGFLQRVKASLNRGWEAFVSFAVWLIGTWPFMIVFAALWAVIRRYRRKRRN